MSLNSNWFKNGQPSKLKVHKQNPSYETIPYLDGLFFCSSNFDGWPFWNQWKFRDIMYLILKVKCQLCFIWIQGV